MTHPSSIPRYSSRAHRSLYTLVYLCPSYEHNEWSRAQGLLTDSILLEPISPSPAAQSSLRACPLLWYLATVLLHYSTTLPLP